MKNKFILYINTDRHEIHKNELIDIINSFDFNAVKTGWRGNYINRFSIWHSDFSTVFNYLYDKTVHKHCYSIKNTKYKTMPLDYKFECIDKDIENVVNDFLSKLIPYNDVEKLLGKV